MNLLKEIEVLKFLVVQGQTTSTILFVMGVVSWLVNLYFKFRRRNLDLKNANAESTTKEMEEKLKQAEFESRIERLKRETEAIRNAKFKDSDN